MLPGIVGAEQPALTKDVAAEVARLQERDRVQADHDAGLTMVRPAALLIPRFGLNRLPTFG
jgi:hypothetical protein